MWKNNWFTAGSNACGWPDFLHLILIILLLNTLIICPDGLNIFHNRMISNTWVVIGVSPGLELTNSQVIAIENQLEKNNW